MRRVDIAMRLRTTVGTYPDSYPQVTQSTRSRPVQTDRTSRTGEPFRRLAVDCPKPHGCVSQERASDAPGGIVDRLRKPGPGQFWTRHIPPGKQATLPGNSRGGFMRPVFATVADFGMERFDALRFMGALGHRELRSVVPRQVLSGKWCGQMRTGGLLFAPQVNANLPLLWAAWYRPPHTGNGRTSSPAHLA
jgi:hypothetical protein